LKEFHFNPPPPSPPPPPAPDIGKNWRIQIKDGTVVAANSPVGELLAFATIRLHVVITDIDRKQQATFVASAEGITVGGQLAPSFLPAGGTLTRVTQGPPQGFRTKQSMTLSRFSGKVTMGQNPGAGAGPLSTGGKFVMEFDNKMGGTEPGTVEVKGGDDPAPSLIPAGSLGIQPGIGTFTMEGTPAAVVP